MWSYENFVTSVGLSHSDNQGSLSWGSCPVVVMS